MDLISTSYNTLNPKPLTRSSLDVDVSEEKVYSDPPLKRDQILFLNRLDLHRKSPDSGESEYESRT